MSRVSTNSVKGSTGQRKLDGFTAQLYTGYKKSLRRMYHGSQLNKEQAERKYARAHGRARGFKQDKSYKYRYFYAEGGHGKKHIPAPYEEVERGATLEGEGAAAVPQKQAPQRLHRRLATDESHPGTFQHVEDPRRLLGRKNSESSRNVIGVAGPRTNIKQLLSMEMQKTLQHIPDPPTPPPPPPPFHTHGWRSVKDMAALQLPETAGPPGPESIAPKAQTYAKKHKVFVESSDVLWRSRYPASYVPPPAPASSKQPPQVQTSPIVARRRLHKELQSSAVFMSPIYGTIHVGTGDDVAMGSTD